MVKYKTEIRFKTEAELCAAFIASVPKPWIAYAETCGWDILLVASDGTQIGVQAKLRFNTAVLEQAIESRWADGIGPDYRAVLVPKGNQNLCDALGLILLAPILYISLKFNFPGLDQAAFWNPKRRHQLPEYIPDVPAGMPSPVQLTKWKMAALKITAMIELRGYVCREDFRVFGIDHRRWMQQWLEGNTDGRFTWRHGINQGFDTQHPTVYPKIRDEIRSMIIP